MYNNEVSSDHKAYYNILETRGMSELKKGMPLWQFRLTDSEYEELKQTLRSHTHELYRYGIEAALCYAEWWRRDYKGNIPSKEDVAVSIGIYRGYAENLYLAARNALKQNGYTFIHSLKGTEYFRTLLNQGGLPVNYIKNNDGNMGSFSGFLKGLVRELSMINYDWNDKDNSIIEQFNCISYLGKAFKNENIYDVAMQIAHAIIMDDNALLPYDDTDASLAELTNSLKKEYTRARSERRIRPLSLHWKLKTTSDGHGYLFVNMDVVKEISSDSIPGLDISTCYSFDVFVAGTLVGKYVRKSINRDTEGEIINATYTRISVGMNKDILWKGEPVVEVKVRCDNDDRIFLTIAGCYPPNFEYPQVFQMIDDNLYSKSETANAENNIAIFTSEWRNSESKSIIIEKNELFFNEFTQSLVLENATTGETKSLTNEFTSYAAEFSGNYLTWVEKSNYKLLSKIPIIRVYDKDKKRVQNCKTKYRVRNDINKSWRTLNSSCVLPYGLVDISVEFPDGHSTMETFYAIRNLCFDSKNENIYSTEIICNAEPIMRVEPENTENLNIDKLDSNHWRIERNRNSSSCPNVIGFRLYNAGNPTLNLSVAIPFNGVMIADINGKIVPNGKIISFANLSNFCIISHGNKNGNVDVSYISDRIEDVTKLKHLHSTVIDGLVSLSDYSDLIVRMFNLYGANSFDRTSSVVLNVSGKEIYIRKFILDSTINEGKIEITDTTERDTSGFVYTGDLYCFPLGDSLPTEEFFPVQLEREEEMSNTFLFPEDFTHQELVIFSGPEVRRRIIPKYYNRNQDDFDKQERASHASNITNSWYDMLLSENVMTGKHWRDVCKAFDICSHYNLPFTTYNGLKSIARTPKLVAKFIIAMWLNEYKDILTQEIDRFEQEMVIALHWVSKNLWEDSINEFFHSVPSQLLPMMYAKMQSFVELLQELFNSTVSTDISEKLAAYLVSGTLDNGRMLTRSDINNYKMKIHGLSDTNKDLPLVKHNLQMQYYPFWESMLVSYRVMIESAMCAAENACNVENCTDLFSREGREHARVVNFYRKYFKETYSDIFFNTLKFIVKPTDRI